MRGEATAAGAFASAATSSGTGVAASNGGLQGVEVREVGVAQANLRSADVFFQVRAVSGSWNRDDVLALRQHPRQRNLTVRRAGAARDRLNLLDESLVAIEVLALEARQRSAEVGRCDVALREPPGQKSAPERREREKPD